MESRGLLKRLIVGLFALYGHPSSHRMAGLRVTRSIRPFARTISARLQALLKGGADANISDPRGGSTPLMHAAAVGSVESMKLLLDNARTSMPSTAPAPRR